ncbi:ATP-binding protein [Amycolatopsis minnesotensis]|uniref:HTH luxR-type domain-containing protein n=1 Tax=Amycolatopsis minnesotensis TaxID=337894 RepID=A0ABN2S5V1_9PSEU
MVLTERADELATLTALFDDAAGGAGNCALVSGPVASGKTELLTVAAAVAAGRGAVVLTALGAAAERGTPLALFSQLITDAPLDPAARERAERLLSGASRGEGSGHVRTTVVHELSALLAGLTAEKPVVLVADDIQHGDPASLRCVLALVKRLRAARATVLLGETDQTRDADPLFHSELLRQPHSHRVRLAPLSLAGVRTALSRRGSGPAAEFHSASGGNPLLLKALLEDHDTALSTLGAGHDWAPVAGEAFRRAVVTCLRRGDDLALRVARGIAVLGGDADSHDIARLLDLDPALAAGATRTLTAAGLLAPNGFRHPAAPAAVRHDLGPAALAALHGKAAELRHERNAPATAVAEHLLAAGGPAKPWAVPALREAAHHALLGDRVEPAVRYLELALRLCGDEAVRAEVLVALADAEWRIDPASTARRMGALVAAVRTGHLDGAHAHSALRHLLWHGRAEEAAEVLRRCHGEHGTSRAADLITTRRWLAVSHPAQLERAPSPRIPRQGTGARTGLAPVVEADPRRTATNALHAVLTRGAVKEAIAGAEQVLESVRLGDSTIDPIESALLTLLYADRAGKAGPWCDLLLAEAAERGAPSWEAALSALRAETALRLGDVPAAAASARTALAHLPPSGLVPAAGVALGALVLALTAEGEHAEVAALLAEPLPRAVVESRAGLHLLYARGQHRLATNRLHAALADFRLCGELMTRWRLDVPALVPWRSAAAEAHLRLGERAAAERLAVEQLARCGDGHSRSRGISLRAAANHVADPGKLLRAAEHELVACGDLLEVARVRAELATVRQGGGEPAETCGGEHCARCVPGSHPGRAASGAAQRDGGSRRRGRTRQATALTDAERRVAELAALGHTNLEIARKLYITVSTVEQHLTRVYRKLNVRRRTELPIGLQVAADAAFAAN